MLTATYDTHENQMAMLAKAEVGIRVTFEGERMPYTVQARSERYLVCTKPFAAQRTVIYTIVDMLEGVRGTENLIFGSGFETRKQCEEAIDRLEGRDTELGFTTEVSHRNRVSLRVKKVQAQQPGKDA